MLSSNLILEKSRIFVVLAFLGRHLTFFGNDYFGPIPVLGAGNVSGNKGRVLAEKILVPYYI